MAGTVTVALKMPHGLHLRLFDMIDHDEPVMGGGFKTVPRAVLNPADPVKVYGYAKKWDEPFAADDKGNPILLMGGYALTPGVDAEFFAEWMKQNETSDLVRNNLIFATNKTAETNAMAREFATTRSGLEPLAPDDRADRRVPRGIKKMGTEAAA